MVSKCHKITFTIFYFVIYIRDGERIDNKYCKGIKITDAELGRVNIIRDEFHGEWNYSIQPKYP